MHRNNAKKAAAGLLVAALAVAAVAPASAIRPGLEGTVVTSDASLANAAASIKDSIKQFLKEQRQRIKKGETVSQCPAGTHPSQEGELGTVCRNDKPYSVSCEIVGWKKVTDETGERLEPILGECDPKGGFGGDGSPRQDPPQAP